jgi:HK97 family phage portal protein
MSRKPAATKKPAAPRRSRAKPFELRAIEPFFLERPDSVTAQTAIRVTAILACVRFVAQSLASCPIHIMRNIGQGRREPARDLPIYRTLSKAPNFWMSSYEYIELMGHHCALWGSAYSRIVPGPRGGFAEQLLPLHPSRVTPKLVADRNGQPIDIVYDYVGPDGGRTYSRDEILHFRWLSDDSVKGLVPSELCGTAVGLARKLDAAASSYWENSARPDVILETQETIPPEAVEKLRQQWREMYGGPKRAGSTAVLPKKVTARVVEGSSREASQYMELRNAIVGEIARAFGIPSSIIGHEAAGRWASVEQEFLSVQVFTILPWLRRFEQTIDRSLLSTYGDDVYCKLDNRGLLRGDGAARAAMYQTLFNLGAITPNEIRGLEDFDRLGNVAADETYMQLGFAPLGTNMQGGTDGNGA